MESLQKHPVVCFGEVLWDVFPTGSVPGGAPMNVAYHLHKQKKNPALITKIGIDEEGEKLVNIFSNQGMCTDYFQLDYKNQTGKVYAKPGLDHEVVYDIVMPVAWDFIQWEEGLRELVAGAEFFVFGSLAARNSISKETLFSLLDISKNNVLDINLRTPHFNRQTVSDLLKRADFLKMNIAELELITGWFSNYKSIEERIKSLRDRFEISNMVITMGGEGAMLFMNGDIIKHEGFKVAVVDTVGSGDAFLAGLLGKLLEGADPAESLEYAGRLGAYVATQRGACPDYSLEDLIPHQTIGNEKI